MYRKPFYIKEPVGNNAFSYDERENKQLYIPELIEINNLDDIEIQPHPNPLLEEREQKVSFEDYDFDGKLSTNYGLKNFYKISPHPNPLPKGEGITAPIYLFDNHNHAYYFWFLARNEGVIGDNNTLIHIDEHSDTRDCSQYLLKPDSLDLKNVFEFTNQVLNVGNYIIPAQKEGLIGDLIQIRNETNLRDYLTTPLTPLLQEMGIKQSQPPSPVGEGIQEGGYILNLDLDFFQPDLDFIDYELKKKVILEAAKKAKVITVATSPFFIEQELAIKVFKDIFG